MPVKLVKYYKWFKVDSVSIPSYNEHDDTEIDQMIQPHDGHGWRRTYLNPSNGFPTVEEAEKALIDWAQHYGGSWQEYILQTCYKPETD